MLQALVVDKELYPEVRGQRALPVHSVFARAANLRGESASARLVTLASTDIPAGPRTIIVDDFASLDLEPGASFDMGRISWDEVAFWEPPAFPSVFSAEAVAWAEDKLASAKPKLAAFDALAWEHLERVVASESDLGESASELIGLGPGLTPAGDDYVAGFALGRYARGDEATLGRLANAVGAGRTTEVSTVMLTEALRGRANAPLCALVEVLALSTAENLGNPSAETGPVEDALQQVLEIGHTSGYAMASGLLAALKH